MAIPNSLEGVKAFARTHGLALMVAHDSDGEVVANALATDLAEHGVPMHVVEGAYFYLVETLREHAETGRGYVAKKIVILGYTSDWNDRVYAVAMHEFGHVFSDNQANERAAWQWAQDNASEWSDAMERIKSEALDSYEKPDTPDWLSQFSSFAKP